MVSKSLYNIVRPNYENASLPVFLNRACKGLNLENLPLSGWTQYYLYISLYCTDVEKPRNEIQIKESVPPEIQQSLHTRWLNEILIHSQPQVRIILIHILGF